MDVSEEDLLANLEDSYLPVRSVTPVAPSKQSTAADASPLARSVGSAKSSASGGTLHSDQERLQGLLKASSEGIIPQPAASAIGGETASTSEVSYFDEILH